MKIAGPTFVAVLLSEAMSNINMIYAGQVGTELTIAGMGLANMLNYTLCASITTGIASVQETLVS